MITEQTEIKFWHWLQRKLSNEKVDMQRIENTTGSGVPDVNMCHKGSDAWIELKVYVRGNVVLRKEQFAWITRRSMHDGNVMVIALHEEENEVHVWCPSPINRLEARPWGNTGKYVSIESSPDHTYSKTVETKVLLRTIFDI